MKRNHRTKSLNIPNSRWLAYATAGAATAFGAVSPAETEIHYSGIVHQPFQGDTVNFDLHHSAWLSFKKYSFYYYGFSVARAAVSGQFRGYTGHQFRVPYVSRLSAGVPVSQGDFLGTPQDRRGLLGSSYGLFGLWNNNRNWPHRVGFIGFRFDNGFGKQYGWLRVRVGPSGADFGFDLVILDYAWGDPGDSILTGQKRSSGEMVDAMTSEGSLGLLAVGGTGLDAWRKERAKSVRSQP
jgi:hypothetical protein